VLVFAVGLPSSGIPTAWAAAAERPGIALLPDLSERSVETLAARVRAAKRPGDVVVVSIHWGENWGYAIPQEQVRFAHALIDSAGVDVVFGHSSHHAKGIEVYRGKLVLYGAGDLINDYEGISGHEEFRPDLAVLYTATVEPSSGRLRELRMTPFQLKRLRLERASRADVRWLRGVLSREGEPLGTRVESAPDRELRLRWE
ncbi:MAG: CapA family protein, partial [Myxococcota bacterium]